MKLIIDIPDMYYDALKQTDMFISGKRSGKTLESVIYNAIGKGTPIIESEDTISRQAVLGYIVNDLELGDEENGADLERKMELQSSYDYIASLPSVQPKVKIGEWVSAKDRLPSDRNWYLGIFKETDTGWVNPIPFVCDYVGKETKATTKDFWILRGLTDIDNPCDYYKNLECVAWTELPNYEQI